MAKRPYPANFDEYHQIAIMAGLHNPVGRALYACNRKQMGWPSEGPYGTLVDPLVVMQKCEITTASRWLKHWESGGHIRSISLTREEYLKINNQRVRERRADYKKRGIK